MGFFSFGSTVTFPAHLSCPELGDTEAKPPPLHGWCVANATSLLRSLFLYVMKSAFTATLTWT